MNEKPILFSGAMVRAILDGRKTQTRRVVKFPPKVCKEWEIKGACDAYGYFGPSCVDDMHGFVVAGDHGIAEVACPYGVAGDRLWVRETFCHDPLPINGILYREGWPLTTPAQGWKPSIFMPRWASRITLDIVSVRVERVQDISEGDAIAEVLQSRKEPDDFEEWLGVETWWYRPQRAFEDLWDSINGDRKDKHGNRLPYGWADNPWVWVVEFRADDGKSAGGAA